MRYTPDTLNAIKNNTVFSSDNPVHVDFICYAADIMFINDWLEKHFYSEFGDPIELDSFEKTNFCAVLLGCYYNDDAYCGVMVGENIHHFKSLTSWLEEHNNDCCNEESDTLLDILQGTL